MKTLDRRSGVQIAMKTLDQAYLGVTVREQRGAFSDYHLQVTQNISPHLTLSLSRYFGRESAEMVIVSCVHHLHVSKSEHIKLFKIP